MGTFDTEDQAIGVRNMKSKNKYRSRIKKDGKVYSLGYFEIPEDAAKARDLKAVELFGTFAKLNFPII